MGFEEMYDQLVLSEEIEDLDRKIKDREVVK